MKEVNKIGTYKSVAEPFHVDFNGRLTMGYLVIIYSTAQAFMLLNVALVLPI